MIPFIYIAFMFMPSYILEYHDVGTHGDCRRVERTNSRKENTCSRALATTQNRYKVYGRHNINKRV
jgi:hypothetical protein